MLAILHSNFVVSALLVYLSLPGIQHIS